MSRVDVHPEELLDAARRGELDDAERDRLEAHLAHCTACAVEHRAMADFDRELVPREGDEEITARLVAGALARAGLPQPSADRSERDRGATPRPARRRTAAVAAAALVVGLFGGAAAAWWAMSARETEPAGPAPEPAPREPVTAPDTQVVEPAPYLEESVEEEAPPEEAAVAEATAEPVEAAPAPEARPEPAVPPSAEELLARANAARREGRYDAAVRLYRMLQRVHPGSREAAVSRVTLGRLLLDGRGDASAALAEFQAYLAAHPRGVLAEEARVGRALALGRLGRTADERAAWRELLTHHPDSLHAERARQHLR